MEKELAALGMAGTSFETRFAADVEAADAPPFAVHGKKLTERGIDQVEFYFSPNPGEPVKPLARIASGGELSRLMLAIKSLALARGEIPTLLFDEVDAGIGGRVAEIVGQKLKKVAAAHQVICVTHLPQIAALADAHYAVEKEVARGRTFTRVKRLGERERVAEVARMLAGVKVTDKAMRHAEEMVKSGREAEKEKGPPRLPAWRPAVALPGLRKPYCGCVVNVVQKLVPTLGCGFAAAGTETLTEPASPTGAAPSPKILRKSSTPAVPPAAWVKANEVPAGI